MGHAHSLTEVKVNGACTLATEVKVNGACTLADGNKVCLNIE